MAGGATRKGSASTPLRRTTQRTRAGGSVSVAWGAAATEPLYRGDEGAGSRGYRAAAQKCRGILKTSEERSNTMTAESIEQMKARLKREDEEKEEAFQKRLEEIKESQAEFRAGREAKGRAEEQERERLHEERRQRREEEIKT